MVLHDWKYLEPMWTPVIKTPLQEAVEQADELVEFARDQIHENRRKRRRRTDRTKWWLANCGLTWLDANTHFPSIHHHLGVIGGSIYNY